ncbi:hypothetical protein BpHYR1_042286 [Brachionus plicatilis]|uniref:Uncharacterized protein n=1 Tax=Brachionus plicatilis TaxID=10195 RepID=A0A3M7R513_BRAPC|nr:hypothetical protein BpHYR1_042286 [Brachionus plicatilis]
MNFLKIRDKVVPHLNRLFEIRAIFLNRLAEFLQRLNLSDTKFLSADTFCRTKRKKTNLQILKSCLKDTSLKLSPSPGFKILNTEEELKRHLC